MSKSRRKPTICVDFDGVINRYDSGWQGATTISDPPTDGFVRWLSVATMYFTVAIYSSRSHQEGGIDAMQGYVWNAICAYYDDADPREFERAIELRDAIEWPDHKPAAFITIDDRALTFTGNWLDFDPQELVGFLPWNKNPKLGQKGMPQSIGSIAVANQRKSPTRRFLTGLRWALSRRPS